jgi:hypothetical protein
MAPEIARLFLSSNVMHCIFIDADELDHFLVQQDALLHRNCPCLVIRFWIVDCDFDFGSRSLAAHRISLGSFNVSTHLILISPDVLLSVQTLVEYSTDALIKEFNWEYGTLRGRKHPCDDAGTALKIVQG